MKTKNEIMLTDETFGLIDMIYKNSDTNDYQSLLRIANISSIELLHFITNNNFLEGQELANIKRKLGITRARRAEAFWHNRAYINLSEKRVSGKIIKRIFLNSLSPSERLDLDTIINKKNASTKDYAIRGTDNKNLQKIKLKQYRNINPQIISEAIASIDLPSQVNIAAQAAFLAGGNIIDIIHTHKQNILENIRIYELYQTEKLNQRKDSCEREVYLSKKKKRDNRLKP